MFIKQQGKIEDVVNKLVKEMETDLGSLVNEQKKYIDFWQQFASILTTTEYVDEHKGIVYTDSVVCRATNSTKAKKIKRLAKKLEICSDAKIDWCKDSKRFEVTITFKKPVNAYVMGFVVVYVNDEYKKNN